MLFIRAERAGCGVTAHGKFCRECNMAENKDEQQIDDQKRAAAVAAEFVWKAPDVGHADGRADRRENKAPAAGKMFGVFSYAFRPARMAGSLSLSLRKKRPTKSQTASALYIFSIVNRLSVKVKENLFLCTMI